MFVCHDYAPNGREFLWETTVGVQRENNIHVGNNASEDGFTEMREKRDAAAMLRFDYAIDTGEYAGGPYA